MAYKCPKCSSPRQNESKEIIDSNLVIQITYENGCVLRMVREGNVWKIIFEHCKTFGI